MNHRDRYDKILRFREAIDAGDYELLPEREQKECFRVHVVLGLLLDPTKVTDDIVQMIVKEHGVTARTVHNDIALSREIFGDLQATSRTLDALIIFQRAEASYQRCLALKDEDGVQSALKLMMQIKGLDRPQENTIDPNQYIPVPTELRLSGKSKKVIDAIAASGAFDFETYLKGVPEAHVVENAQLPPGNGAEGH